jgi:hypothetical protein
MGLQVKRGTIQDATSSKLILDDPISRKKESLRLDIAEMEPGPRRAKKTILAISSIKKAILITLDT